MQKPDRRVFMIRVIAGGAAVSVAGTSLAEEEEKMSETDPYAKSMGFKFDTNQVDKKRYPRHDAATQSCIKCQLYDGKPGDAWGACSFFGGRLVKPTGWCKNFKAVKA